MSFTCNENKNLTYSVYKVTNLITNVYSKIKEGKFSEGEKAAQI